MFISFLINLSFSVNHSPQCFLSWYLSHRCHVRKHPVDAVVVPKDKSADLTPTARKVACGAAEVVPFARVTNIVRTLDALKERGVWIFGTAGESEKTIYDNDLSGSMALVMGAEGAGLRRLTREHCDFLIKLPMAGSVSSLNVSVATGICLFEAVRQRGPV